MEQLQKALESPMTSTIRKRAERLRRKDAGYTRLECWVSAETRQGIERIMELIDQGDVTVEAAIAHAVFYGQKYA